MSRKASRALILLVLGGAVAGWGCALLSGGEESRAQQQQRQWESDAKYADLLQQFDTLAGEQREPPYVGTLQRLYDFLIKAEQLPSWGIRGDAPLVQRHEKLANWGYGYSQLWLGNNLNPCFNQNQSRTRSGDYLMLVGRARIWYEKAAAQTQPGAAEALADLESCKVPKP
jgi:hypothetical protein